MMPLAENPASPEVVHDGVVRKMLRRENRAILACVSARPMIHDEAFRDRVGRILDEHQNSVRILKDRHKHVSELETTEEPTPVAESELDGLERLLREETLCERLYRGSLENADLDDSFRFQLASRFLPVCQRNRAFLERALASLQGTCPPTTTVAATTAVPR
jgi:hypothetical protein